MEENHNGIPVKEIGELLNEVTDKVPKLINGLMQSMYSAEAGRNMGKAVGGLFMELIESGIPREDALQMAKDYMLTLKDVASSLKQQ